MNTLQWALGLSFSFMLPVALAGASVPEQVSRVAAVTEEQAQAVQEAARKVHERGLPPPLEVAPNVEHFETVLVSDAVSLVEVAHVDFSTKTFFLSIQNPWTTEIAWYGAFYLDS